jgi:hypothetical protein
MLLRSAGYATLLLSYYYPLEIPMLLTGEEFADIHD